MDKRRRKTIGIYLFVEIVTCLFVFRQYIAGSRLFAFTDIASDTTHLYLPQYAAIIGKIRAHDFSLWDPNNGFGINMNMLNMTNPALMIVYLLGSVLGIKAVPFLMLWIYLAEILLSGLAVYALLSLFSLSEGTRLIIVFMYTLNGFMTVWGEHYQFGIVCILVPLMLYFAERYLRDRKKWLSLVIMTFVLVMNSMYIAYMTLIFTGFFVVARLLMREWRGWKIFFRDLFRAAGTMLLGVALAGVFLLPSVAAIAGVSSRLDSQQPLYDRLLKARYPRIYYVVLFGRLFSATSRGISNYKGWYNFSEDPCLYFTVPFVFLGIQYLCLLPRMRKSLRFKAVSYLCFGVVFFSACLPFTGIVMNGLTAPFSRYFYLFMTYFACISAVAVEEILKRKRVNVPGILASLVLLSRYAYVCYYADLPNSKQVVLVHAAVGAATALILLSIRLGRDRAVRVCAVLLAACTAFDAGADAWVVFDAPSETSFIDSRLAITPDGKYMSTMFDPDIREAVDAIHAQEGKTLVRTDKIFGTTLSLDSLMQGYMPVSTYNSTMNSRILRFADKYWPSLYCQDRNHLSYESGFRNREASALTGVRYILKREEDPDVEGTEVWKKFGHITVLVDPTVTSISSFYKNGSFKEIRDGCDLAFSSRDRTAAITMTKGDNSSAFFAEVENDSDGLLFTAIPFENGWSVYVDGERADLIPADEGFIGVKLTAGRHSIRYQYRCPGVREGCVLSLAALLFLLAVLLKKRKGEKRHGFTHHAV